MWLKDFFKGWLISLVLLVVFIPVGCGKGDVQSTNLTGGYASPGVTGGSCPAGQMSVNGLPCFSGSDPALFYRNCTYMGNFLTIGGVQVCRMDMAMGQYYYSAFSSSISFPRLGPGTPADSNSANPGIVVRKNDKLNISSTGNWGHERLTWFFGSPDC